MDGDTAVNHLVVSASGGFLSVKDGNTDLVAPNTISASAVTSIQVDASSGDDTVDLSNVTSAVFTNLSSAPELFGSGGVDTITGSQLDDVIWGGTGGDTLIGEQGDDTLNGGADNDLLVGGAGADSCAPGSGTNEIWIFGDISDINGDTFSDDGGTDTLDCAGASGGGLITFTMWSGLENCLGTIAGDVITGNGLDNDIWGGGGIDQLYGSGGNDELFGEGGDDYAEGGDGDDEFTGGSGADEFVGGGGANDIFIDFSAGEGDSFTQ